MACPAWRTTKPLSRPSTLDTRPETQIPEILTLETSTLETRTLEILGRHPSMNAKFLAELRRAFALGTPQSPNRERTETPWPVAPDWADMAITPRFPGWIADTRVACIVAGRWLRQANEIFRRSGTAFTAGRFRSARIPAARNPGSGGAPPSIRSGGTMPPLRGPYFFGAIGIGPSRYPGGSLGRMNWVWPLMIGLCWVSLQFTSPTKVSGARRR
jgi:hypothetical protein